MILRLLLISLLAIAVADGAGKRPNLVIILADDCTYLDMEVYGGQAKTPHLNKLASEGMTFSRCFQAAPMCSPTRHNLYTGIYPVKSGAWPNHTAVYPGTRSIAHHLQPAGYRTALSGKTHIGPKASFPFEYSMDFAKDGRKTQPIYPKIRKLLRESKEADAPFCLIACSKEPHTPWDKGDASAYPPDQLKLPPTWVDTPETREAYARYLAEITYFDWQCGQLLRLLDEYKLRRNTLVVVLSEQGSSFPFAKWTCYEMGLASGMIARWPATVAAGSSTDAMVEYVDITPTFLDAAGVGIPEILDGRSFLPVLTGEADTHKEFTYGLHTTRGIINGSEAFGIRSIGTATHRYILNLHPETTFTNAVTGKYEAGWWASWTDKAKSGDDHAAAMVRHYQHRPAEELYDIVKDPHCTRNLIDDPALAATRKDLRQRLEKWMESQGDKGDETERLALTRMPRHQEKKSKPRGSSGRKQD